jgi:branched-chain amino acid transport system permease protein
MLDLSMTLCTEPHLILLDEPCAGLSPAEAKQVIDTIRWAATTFKATALIIEHDMTLVRELADRVYVLHNGSLLAEGAVAEIQNNAAVKAVYSGGER